MFFNANGTPHLQVRRKPNVTAADGVSTSLAQFTPFFGTSAAAPHAAAIAALVVSGNPGAGTATVRRAFNATALDLTPAGVDPRTGPGLIRADRVLAYTGGTPQPVIEAGQPTLRPTTGDGDAYLEPGETGTMTLPLANVGDGPATAVAVAATSGDPKVTLTPPTRTYATIAAGAAASQNFTVSLAANYPLGKPVTVALHITYGQPRSPVDTTVRLKTGQPATTARTFAYAGSPVAIPDRDPAGAAVPITVSGVGYAANLSFSIDGSACTAAEGATTVGIDHTFVADLTATLTAPDGRTATLFGHAGGVGNNLCRVVFDDAASRTLADASAGLAPFTGTWSPIDPLAGLLTSPVDGTWTFSVVDGAPSDVGSIRAVSLHITGFQPA